MAGLISGANGARISARRSGQASGLALVALLASASVTTAQTGGQDPPREAAQAELPPQAQAAPAEGTASGNTGDGLRDLSAMTFHCVRAGLNAAAREVASKPSEGAYQFSYFRIINDSHHATYEVHFKSNYQGEPDRKYCVAIYCQQGWDPAETEVHVTPIAERPQRTRRAAPPAAHGADCSAQHGPTSGRAIQR